MALPEVAQTQALSKLMASALKEYTPASLAVIGCTTGNGFEHIDHTHTHRVVGVDINAAYLAVLKDTVCWQNSTSGVDRGRYHCPGFRIRPGIDGVRRARV